MIEWFMHGGNAAFCQPTLTTCYYYHNIILTGHIIGPDRSIRLLILNTEIIVSFTTILNATFNSLILYCTATVTRLTSIVMVTIVSIVWWRYGCKSQWWLEHGWVTCQFLWISRIHLTQPRDSSFLSINWVHQITVPVNCYLLWISQVHTSIFCLLVRLHLSAWE